MGCVAAIAAFIVSWIAGVLIFGALAQQARAWHIGTILTAIGVIPAVIAWITRGCVDRAVEAAREAREARRRQTEAQLYAQEQSRRQEDERRRRAEQAAKDAARQAELAEAQKRQQALEAARRSEIERLLTAGRILSPPNEMVVCSNGHRYKYEDFHIDTAETVTHYEGAYFPGDHDRQYVETVTYSKEGCPLCKSTAFDFEDEHLNRFRRCRCGYWYDENYTPRCPVCALGEAGTGAEHVS